MSEKKLGGSREICLVFICSHSFPLQYLNVSVAYVCHWGICTWVFVYSWSRNKFHRHTDPGWNPSEIWPTFHQNSPMSRSSSHQTTSMDFCFYFSYYFLKVEKISEDSLDLISSSSPWVKIQIMGGKVCLRCKGKTLLGVVNKLLKAKSNVLPYYLK